MPASPASRRWVVIVIVATLAEATVSRQLKVLHWQPSIVLLSLVYLGLTAGRTVTVIMGFLSGLYADLYAPQLLGTHALAYTTTAYLAGIVGEKIQAERASIQMLSLFTLSLLCDAVVCVVTGTPRLPAFLLTRAAPSALYTTVVGLVLAMLLSDWLMPREWARHDTSRRRRVR